MVCFSSSAKSAAKAFGGGDPKDPNKIDTTYIDIIPIIFLIVYVPFNFVVIKTLEKSGIRLTMQIAGITTIVGCWLRIACWKDDANGILPLLIGSTIAAIGQPFYLNSASALASEWFGANEIAIATSIGTLAFPFGALLGFLMPAYFYGSTPPERVAPDVLFHQTMQYIFIMNLMNSILCAGSLFMFKNKPPSPPSADVLDGENNLPMGKGFV